MCRFSRLVSDLWMRPLTVLQIFLLAVMPGCVHPGALAPQPGVLEYRDLLRVEVSGGEVDVGGGNLMIHRMDLSIDTLIGTLEVDAVYNSSTRSWIRSFEARYDGEIFVDGTGAVHEMAGLAPGEAVPGTHWVKVDSTRVKTKGGLVHEFDPDTHLLHSLSLGVGALPELVYGVATVSGSVRIVSASQCDAYGICRSVYDIDYDDNGCVLRIADRADRVAEFESDSWCRPLVARDGLDMARGWPGRRYEYSGGLMTSISNSEGEKTRYDYLDGRVVAVRQIGAGMRVTRFDYGMSTESGLYYTRVRNARGGDSVYRYDGDGRLYEYTDAMRDELSYGWTGRRPAWSVDRSGARTSLVYLDDDPVLVTLPSGNQLAFDYAPDAHDRRYPTKRPIRRASDLVGLIESRTYDVYGRLQSTENGAGDRSTFAYDAGGSLMFVGSPDGTITWLEDYAEHGHAGRVIRYTVTENRQYDAVGNLIEGAGIRHPLSPGRPGIGRRIFDENRNIRSLELFGSDSLEALAETAQSLEIERRSDGRVLRLTRPFGGDVEMLYDEFGDLIERRERIDGIWRATVYEWDAGGALTAIELPNGMRREMDVDLMGRTIETRLLRNGVSVQNMSATYQQGRLVRRFDSGQGGPERIFYDGAGRVERIQHPDGEVEEIAYDLRSREIRRIYRMGVSELPLRTIERAYDAANREVELRDDGEVVMSKIISGGRIAEIRYGNGLIRRFDYEPDMGLLTGTETSTSDGSILVESTRIAWAECGGDALCVTSRTELSGSPGGLSPMISYEGYRLGPLVPAQSGAGTPGSRVESYLPSDIPSTLGFGAPEYIFDALGNWLGVMENGAPERKFVFNGERNRLLRAEGAEVHDYEWDDAGFVTKRDGEVFQWSPNGRPTEIGSDVSFRWDVLGRPISTTIQGVTTRMRFGGRVLADALGTPVRLDLGEVSIDLAINRRLYRHHDFRGNVQLVTDDAGEAVLHRTYSPFGVVETFGTDDDDRSFAGGMEISGLLMLGARLYDPAVGRFLSPDPIRNFVNDFAYTLGNPILLWDPGGEMSRPATVSLIRDVADALVNIGLALFVVGVTSGNLSLTATGLVLMSVSIGLKQIANGLAEGCAACRVTIVDLPDAGSQAAVPPRAESIEPPSESCSPTAISAGGGMAWPSLALVGLQLLVAFLWTHWLRVRRRR